MTPRDWPPPGIYDVPLDVPLLTCVAERLLALESEELARSWLLLPSHRACALARRALVAAAGGRAILLPRILPIGDLDEILVPELLEGDPLPPAISPLRRRLLLTRLLMARELSPERAVRLAEELARFLDEIETEEVDLGQLDRLVPEEHAAHWQQVLGFLHILRDAWPKVLAEERVVESARRRRLLLDRLAVRLAAAPPSHPVIALGVSGSVPAVARLLAAIARLPRGWLVLHGLDRELDDASWRALGPSHPQWVFRRLLEEHLGVDRGAVPPFPGLPRGPHARRARLWREVMRPAREAARGQEVTPPGEAELAGLELAEAPDRAAEAVEIALRLRAALERPHHRAILVTTDRQLARRVSAELLRWGVRVDDSAGVPLDQTTPGAFLLLLAHAVLTDGGPTLLLAALKHPLARGGLAAREFRRRVRLLDRLVLRGPRPAGGLAGIRAEIRRRLEEAEKAGGEAEEGTPPHRRPAAQLRELLSWFDGLLQRLAPLDRLARAPRVPLAELFEAHLRAAEALAADEEGRAGLLWREAAGRSLREFVVEMRRAARDFPAVEPGVYPPLLAVLMAGRTVRPAWGAHPRLAILGQIESRLVSADLVVLGAFEEGRWPRPAEVGPWLNRRMREALGLPPVEQKVGFAALDFVAAASAPEVVISRARKDEKGTPTAPSRWLQRLEALLAAAGRRTQDLANQAFAAWRMALDAPDGFAPRPRPEPRPPRPARPREYWASEIEWLMRDPYYIYARHILGLRPLDPVDADPGATEQGRILHAALEAFLRDHGERLPEDPLQALLAKGEEIFARYEAQPEVRAIWWRRFREVARAVVDLERCRRKQLQRVFGEVWGRAAFPLGGQEVFLRARADRIELFDDGAVAIVDYKTGSLPRRSMVKQGIQPQLVVEALIADAGGFLRLEPKSVRRIEYWRLTGRGDQPLEACPWEGEELAALMDGARQGLARLLAAFLDEGTAFHPIPRPQLAAHFNPYDHLARIAEWRGNEMAEDSG